MYHRADLAREAVAGAAASVAAALLTNFIHDTRRRGRMAAGRLVDPEGQPQDWAARLVEFAVLRVAFKAAMDGSRAVTQRVA